MGLTRPSPLVWCVGAVVFIITFFNTIGGRTTLKATLSEYHGRPSLQQHVALAEKIWEKTVMQRHQVMKAWENPEKMPYFPYRDSMNIAHANAVPFSIWELVSPAFSCPYEVERVGRIGDGGKWVCGMSVYENLPPEKPCVIYSFGVSTESSFEEEMLSRTKCELWAYDFSVNDFGPELTDKHRDRAHFVKAGISDVTNSTANPPFYSIADIMKMNGHDYIDILKIDIEWGEYKALSGLASAIPAVNKEFPIGQMMIEIHLHGEETMTGGQFIKWWEVLEDRGMRATWSEFNLLMVTTSGSLPLYCEHTLVNAKDRRNVLFHKS